MCNRFDDLRQHGHDKRQEAKPGECQTKMRAQGSSDGFRYYRCRARDLGIECSQRGVVAKELELKVLDLVRTMKPPADWKENAIEAIGDLLGNQKLKERVAQIEETIKRMDFRWDNGFIPNQEEYLQKRLGLQQELEQLKPMPMDELEAAADILQNFEVHWEKATDNPVEQQRLMHLIFERIWIKNNEVASVCLGPNYHVTFYQHGSDGHPALITIWNLLVAPPSLTATIPFKGYVQDYSMSLN